MKRNSQPKRAYQTPSLVPTEVAFERALLAATARFVLDVDLTETMNDATTDAAGGEMYFEF